MVNKNNITDTLPPNSQHLLTETARETVCFVDPIHRQSRVHKTYCFPEVSVNKYFKRKNKANFIRKYMKYFINFLKDIKFNSVHNVIHKTFAGFGSSKVACSRDGARNFFVIHR